MIKRINEFTGKHSRLIDKIFYGIAVAQMLFGATVAILLDHRVLVSAQSAELQIVTAKIYAMLFIVVWVNMTMVYYVNAKLSKVK
jgi:hypothetical protein